MTTIRSARGFVGRHRALIALGLLTGIILSMMGGWAVYINEQIERVPRFHLNLGDHERPDRPEGRAGKARNILLAGVDKGSGAPVSKVAFGNHWVPGSYRSDTIMIVHFPADRDGVQIVSIPRDSWVPIPGYGLQKINAALSWGGPSLFVKTVENLSNVRMDHVALLDWDGFGAITDSVGGVRIPAHGAEPARVLHGEAALEYVRERKSLPNGDFDRIARQQNFLRALMRELMQEDVARHPLRLTRTMRTVSGNLTVDDKFTAARMRSLAKDVLDLDARDVEFVTLPLGSYDRVDGQSIVRLDRQRTGALFGALLTDDLDRYLDGHPDLGLAQASHVQ